MKNIPMFSKKKLLFYTLSLIALILASIATKTFPQDNPNVTGNLQVIFVDVDQGDATFIRTPRGETMLIDGGEYDTYETHLMPFLSEQGINSVDAAIVTHYHSDHMGGIQLLTEDGGVGTLILPDYSDSDKSKKYLEQAAADNGTQVQYVSSGDTIETACEGLSINVLHPAKGGSNGNNFHNNSSLVLRISYGNTSFLITGDIEARVEKELANTKIECDVLKVAHHGSSSSSSKKFIQAADPTYAVIPVGKNNSYGHPHHETMETLDNEDIRVYRTDTDGNITFDVTAEGINDISFSKF